MFMKSFTLSMLIVLMSLTSCQNTKKQTEKTSSEISEVQSIVDKAIKFSGTEAYKNFKISFDFRDYQLTSEATCEGFKFSREKNDTLDVYKNSGLKRFVSGKEVKVADSTAFKVSEAINSVFYFMQLPMRLNDGAVIKELKGSQTFGNQSYHLVEVKFKKEGGGVDHEDVYMYWFNKENYAMDYFAYKFKVNDGGIRFRAAKNPQKIKDVRFVDYDNYKPESKNENLENLLKLYHQDQLIKVSEIENVNIKVDEIELGC